MLVMIGHRQQLKPKSLMWFRWTLSWLTQSPSVWSVFFKNVLLGIFVLLEMNVMLIVQIIDEIDGALGDGKGAVEVILKLVSHFRNILI